MSYQKDFISKEPSVPGMSWTTQFPQPVNTPAPDVITYLVDTDEAEVMVEGTNFIVNNEFILYIYMNSEVVAAFQPHTWNYISKDGE